ncbi:unnamed protein product [Ceratitis capitata]|uniref:(Mediterranean fruit fly) hypothetical protein n=1 Tax=Ceratitis capitata TaxID=7213 RepID=A0A811UTR9_CERCA|nr:unnamed protein product [Ceratitis capitata]
MWIPPLLILIPIPQIPSGITAVENYPPTSYYILCILNYLQKQKQHPTLQQPPLCDFFAKNISNPFRLNEISDYNDDADDDDDDDDGGGSGDFGWPRTFGTPTPTWTAIEKKTLAN